MTLSGVLSAMRRHLALVVAILLVSAVAVTTHLLMAQREYTAIAQVSFGSDDAEPNQLDVSNLGATVAALVSGRDVLSQVRDDIDGARSVRELRDAVSASWVQNTILVQIVATDPDPTLSARIANSIAANLNDSIPTGERVTLTTTDSATVPETPSAPNVPVTAGAGALLAIIAAAAAAVVVDRRTRRLSTPAEVREALGSPVLATLPPQRGPSVLSALTPGTPLSAAFRSLRIALESARPGSTRIAVVPSSPVTAETAAWVATNLAVSIANLSRRVLLVNGNRSEVYGPAFTGTRHRGGLADVLRGASLESRVLPGPGLDILPAGGEDGRFSEELLEAGFADLAQKLSTSYDSVVVLAPPLESTYDALVLGAGAATLVVVPRGVHQVGELETQVAAMEAVGFAPACAVLVDAGDRPGGRGGRGSRRDGQRGGRRRADR